MKVQRKIRFPLNRQLFVLIFIFVFLIIISDIFVFWSLGKTLKERSIELNSKTLEMICLDLEKQLESIDMMAEILRNEESIISYVSKDYAGKSPEEQQKITKAVTQKLFDSALLQSGIVTNCCLIRTENDYIIQNPTPMGVISDSFIPAAISAIGKRQSARIVEVEVENRSIYCSYFPIYSDTGVQPGKLLFVLNSQMFSTAFGKYMSAGQELFCMDQEGDVMYHSTYNLPSLETEKEVEVFVNQISIVESEKWLHMGTKILDTPFHIHLRIPIHLAMEAMYDTLRFDMLFVSAFVIVLTVTCIFFVRRLYLRVNQVHNVLHHVAEGELDYRYESSQIDEISEIGYGINVMVERINALIIEGARKELAVKTAQFRSVQMQINPHFLFNTLETIRMVALYHSDTQVARIVKDLSDLFRYTIVSSNPIVSINDELNHTLKYLDVQKNRAKNQFKVEIDIDPIVLEHTLLRLVLQPLVENALSHGIEPKYQQCILKIGIHMEDGIIRLVVQDTGVGIEEEKLTMLQKMLAGELPGNDKDEHIGLYNVNERMKLFFGKEAKMTVESTLHKETTVTLLFPAIRYDEKMTVEDLQRNESLRQGEDYEKGNDCR